MDAVQTDWIETLRSSREITSAEMAQFVEKLNRVDPRRGESKQIFSAVETSLVLFGTEDTKSLYELVDSGSIGHTEIGTKNRRRCVFSRYAIYEFLKARCYDAAPKRGTRQ